MLCLHVEQCSARRRRSPAISPRCRPAERRKRRSTNQSRKRAKCGPLTTGRSAAIVVGLPFRPGDQSIALSKFASGLASASDCFTLFAGLPLRRLFVSPYRFHLSKEAFPQHLLFPYY